MNKKIGMSILAHFTRVFDGSLFSFKVLRSSFRTSFYNIPPAIGIRNYVIGSVRHNPIIASW